MNRSILRGIVLVLFCLGFIACTGHTFQYQSNLKIKQLLDTKPKYPSARFIVLSDTHYYDTSLGISGKAFQKALKRDRKLLLQSQEIMQAAVKKILGESIDFLIVCGDLTKDGERVNHMGMQAELRQILRSGKKIYVIPGNHDVANGNAVQYKGRKRIPVQSISGEEFVKIYKDFGYSDALLRDPDSLSYVAEPVSGLWLMALDSSRWKENLSNHHPITKGAFSPKSLKWIETVLIEAKQSNKPVIAFMHHGIMEHYPGNEKYFDRYLVEEYQTISRMLASYGVSLLFSGHFHAQDITVKQFKDPNGFLFDIETGSLITYPTPYRVVSILEDQRALVESKFIASIPSHREDFLNFSKEFLFNNTLNITNKALKKYWVSAKDREIIAPYIARAYMAHLHGDEHKSEKVIETHELGLWGRFIVWLRIDLLEGWWTDLPPCDNFIEIDLLTGDYKRGLPGVR